MKKFLNFLLSFPFMGFLLLMMAFSMAIATFVESSYGTEVAHGLIYNSIWFSLILFLLALNLGVNFIRRKMYTRQRIAVGLFHLSFLVILIGAAITRYISFEGMMHIREGESSNFILSSEDYLTIKTDGQTIQKPVLFSEYSYKDINEKIKSGGQELSIKSVGYIKNAVRTVAADPAGKEMIDFVLSSGQGRESMVFSKGSKVNLGTLVLGYDVPGANVQFVSKGDSLMLISDRPFEHRSMTGGETVSMNANEPLAVQPMNLYAIDNYMLV
ncbi:MAG: cytochrome c biogenesis protein ResB, partial [Bacteroidales bacterium]